MTVLKKSDKVDLQVNPEEPSDGVTSNTISLSADTITAIGDSVLSRMGDTFGGVTAELTPSVEAALNAPLEGLEEIKVEQLPLNAYDHDSGAICFQAPILSPDEPPAEFKILNRGITRMRKGGRIFSIVFDSDAMSDIRENHEAQGRTKLPLDYDHGMLGMIATRESSSAAGWFDLEERSDGLYATNIEWTVKAFESIKEREFRFTSPALMLEDTEEVGVLRVTEVINAALTNLPATVGQKPLVANAQEADSIEETEDMDIKKLMEKFGAKSVEELEAKLSAAEETEKRAATAEAVAEETKQQNQVLLSAAGADSADSFQDRLNALTQKAEEAEAAKAQAVELASKVSTLEADQAKARWQQVFNTGVEQGKLPNSLHDWAKSQSADALLNFLEAAPTVMSSTKVEPAKRADGELELNPAELEVLQKVGRVSVEQFKATKKAALLNVQQDSPWIAPAEALLNGAPASSFKSPYITNYLTKAGS